MELLHGIVTLKEGRTFPVLHDTEIWVRVLLNGDLAWSLAFVTCLDFLLLLNLLYLICVFLFTLGTDTIPCKEIPCPLLSASLLNL